ncbi:hypothetical protein COM13_25275 [Bacillus pseudomycoides]|nr:hypothetical protein CON86_07630 [Bacillus pseudomycoides]PEM65796.1 hypothetical protein CN632_29480 [Bacillus pseudomycoides]PEN07158.1 hypothetical protein CN640_15220 [Bacillus pseudomycoides]PGB79376.1 hypothetical protein COM13_25275 [Bacillus pseudomycoides]PHC86893.1 hypothetical protein COF63_10080 [Bacillus pseudomycoides]
MKFQKELVSFNRDNQLFFFVYFTFVVSPMCSPNRVRKDCSTGDIHSFLGFTPIQKEWRLLRFFLFQMK